MNNVFVLSYSRIDQFCSNYEKHSDINYHFIDNGQQKRIPAFASSFYETSKNIGCAGGWNLICLIAFEHMKLKKILITQDDVRIPESFFIEALDQTYDNIVGILSPYFEFSAFTITRDIFNKIGYFDENFINVYGEDADYKQRCYLNNIHIDSLYLNPKLNDNATIKDNPSLNRLTMNIKYLNKKWGNSIHPNVNARLDNQPPFEYNNPFNGELQENIINNGYEEFIRFKNVRVS